MKREITDLKSQFKYFIDGKQTAIGYQWIKNLGENVYELWSTYSYLCGEKLSKNQTGLILLTRDEPFELEDGIQYNFELKGLVRTI
jgi:hypothetical protein